LIIAKQATNPMIDGLYGIPVSGILSRTVIYLGRLSPNGSSSLPTGIVRAALSCTKCTSPVYLALQPIRFTPAPGRPGVAWALTSRFHPYPPVGGRFFSVALAVA